MPLPSGTITFLFTDIEGSTKLWEEYPDAMRLALARHDALLRQAIEANHGLVFKTVGDAFCAAFSTAPDALAAALAAHLLLLGETWADTGPLRVRMGLHTGEAEERDGDYFGPTLNRVARLQAVGHGQQTLLSHRTCQLVCQNLPADVTLQDMGMHRFKDLLAPDHVWQILHPALPSEFPPLKSLGYLPTNLPHQSTSFIGREREMQEVKQILPSTSLLTLVGSGGAGKTRLALQVGAEVIDDYKDGVWLVELAPLSDPSLIPQTIAAALGLREEMGRTLLQTVQNYLRDRQLLLLLDNCEHVLETCARVADTLIKTCPHLTILATSRELLTIAGERLWRIPSLLTPAPHDLSLEEKDVAAVLMEYDACRLFVERALLQRQDFVLTRSNGPVVAQLCRRLDGIPLAIELAAARVRSLSVEEINTRLDNRFRLLTGGSRTALPRQQTLRALIDWSYDLLNDQEKMLLGRLSVFVGGWTLAAAEAVGAGEGIEDWEVLDLLISLADKSLVVTEQEQGHTRYRLLETVRQYGAEKLEESNEAAQVRKRHRDWYLAFAEEAGSKLNGVEQAHWLNVLDMEHDNLRLALIFCLETPGEAVVGLQLAGAMQKFWTIRGHFFEGRERLTALLAHPEAQERIQVRGSILHAAGMLAFHQSDNAVSRPLFEESLAIYKELEDKTGMTAPLSYLGNLALLQKDYARARSLQEESLAIHRELGNSMGIASSLHSLGIGAHAQGDYDAARALYEESLALKREMGDKRGMAYSLARLVTLVREQGDYALAYSLQNESLGLFQTVGEKRGIAYSFGNLGSVAFDQGDYVSARSLYEEGLGLMRELGDRSGIAYILHYLGNVVYCQGDYILARSLQKESVATQRQLETEEWIAESLESFANLALRDGHPARAAQLLGTLARLREESSSHHASPAQQTRSDRALAETRQASEEEAFQEAWSAGRAMSLEQAIDFAFG